MNYAEIPKTESLSERNDRQRIRRAQFVPESAKKLFAKVWAKKSSPRQAIKAHCLECQGFVREDIATCTAGACPLWNLRPFQKPAKKVLP